MDTVEYLRESFQPGGEPVWQATRVKVLELCDDYEALRRTKKWVVPAVTKDEVAGTVTNRLLYELLLETREVAEQIRRLRGVR